MITLYIAFSYLVFLGMYINEYDSTKLNSVSLQDILITIFAPLTLPILLGALLNEKNKLS